MNNFGVYQPPSGIENIRRSTQINSINQLNSPSRIFEEMSRQGWGGNTPGGNSSTSSSTSPTPSASPSLPPGNLSPEQIDEAMSSSSCNNVCVTLINFFDSDSPTQPTGSEPICFRSRRVRSSVTGQLTNQQVTSWDSDYVNDVWDDGVKGSLSGWFKDFYEDSIGTDWDYFLVDEPTRSRCFSPPLLPSPSLGGNASPPPPPGKQNMCGCDCNTIATIIEERLASQNKPIKDHIDQRTIEQLKAINKMLKGMTIDLDLQPVIDRLNELEANLWNGPQSGG